MNPVGFILIVMARMSSVQESRPFLSHHNTAPEDLDIPRDSEYSLVKSKLFYKPGIIAA